SHLFMHISVTIAFLLILLLLVIRRIKRKNCAKDSQHYPESEQLYVGNLSYQMNGYQLKDFFSKYGDVQSVRLIKNNRTGRSKGFAFVTYSNAKDAKKALESNGEQLRGRPIVVRMAKPREE
ncbi:MAG: RNA-binding protein, partial [Gammaproteobacteria bacterium]|nr:RNA-binding protein [Gammaproteobacteria bacterium]